MSNSDDDTVPNAILTARGSIPKFNGVIPTAQTADSFLRIYKSYCRANNIKGDARTDLLDMAMQGAANNWYKEYQNDYKDDEKVTDWDFFKEKFEERFIPRMHPAARADAWGTLKQSATEPLCSFIDRVRYIGRISQKKFIVPEQYRADERFLLGAKMATKFAVQANIETLFHRGIIDHLKSLVVQQQFDNVEDLFKYALMQEQGLHQTGVIANPEYLQFTTTPNLATKPTTTVNAIRSRGGRGTLSRAGRGGPGYRGGRGGANRPQCSHCHIMGHNYENCWTKFPHKRPGAKATNARSVNEVGYQQETEDEQLDNPQAVINEQHNIIASLQAQLTRLQEQVGHNMESESVCQISKQGRKVRHFSNNQSENMDRANRDIQENMDFQ